MPDKTHRYTNPSAKLLNKVKHYMYIGCCKDSYLQMKLGVYPSVTTKIRREMK